MRGNSEVTEEESLSKKCFSDSEDVVFEVLSLLGWCPYLSETILFHFFFIHVYAPMSLYVVAQF